MINKDNTYQQTIIQIERDDITTSVTNGYAINDDEQSSLISEQSWTSSICGWITNRPFSYFKNKIFPHYQITDKQFQWGWLIFDVIRSNIAYIPKFLKELFLNGHVPLAQAINMYLLPVKSLIESYSRLNPWQIEKVIKVLLVTSSLIAIAELTYLNVKTHDFTNDNNIYTIVDYLVAQTCDVNTIIYSLIDISNSVGSSNISFNLKLLYQFINTGGSLSLLTNPKLNDNLIPILASAVVSGVGCINFVIDEFEKLKTIFNCANSYRNDVLFKKLPLVFKKDNNMIDVPYHEKTPLLIKPVKNFGTFLTGEINALDNRISHSSSTITAKSFKIKG